MLKKINTILVAFMLVLGVNSNLAYFIYLPIYLIYILKDEKNIYYFTIPSIFSLLIFSRTELISYLVIVILTLLFFYLIKLLVKKNALDDWFFKIMIFLYITIVNISYIYLYLKLEYNVLYFVVLDIIGFLIYLYLSGFVSKILRGSYEVREKVLFLDTGINSYYVWYELLVTTLSILVCVAQSNINSSFISIVYASYMAMYFSRKYKNIIGLLFGLVTTIIVYVFTNDLYSTLIIFTSGIYITNSIYTFGVYNAVLAIISINSNNIVMYASLMAVSIVFEIICKFILNVYDDKKFDITGGIVKNNHKEILNFASFLDQFVARFKQSVSLNEKINQGLNIIINKHCDKCPKKQECFSKFNTSLYKNFKEILLNEHINSIDNEFEQYCIDYSALLNTSKLINYQINFDNPNENKKDANNYILLSQINGVSMALKNYVVDKVSKDEIDYSVFEKSKLYLNNLDCIVTYYEVKRTAVDDFLIFIGIKNKKFSDLEIMLESLFEELLSKSISVIFCKQENNTVYVNVIPKILIDITYAYGAIPANNEAICGDNFLVKESENGHMIFAISDGMGKGYNAFYESEMTIHLIEEITKLNIDASTALCILNSFYNVQDYLDRYATLDFLDINRYTKQATFYKMGATSTYIIRRDNTIEKIINKSLPLGLDEEIEQLDVDLHDGDIIIMSSDGIIENLIDELKFDETLIKSKSLHLEQMVHEVFNYVINNKTKTQDDMTLIILKVQEKNC